MRRIQIIVNNGAGTGQAHRVWNETQRLLRGYKIKYVAHTTRYQGHATKLAEKISSMKGDDPIYLIVVGGDGTLNEVLNGITDFDRVRLGVIPTGSGNDFGRNLKLPKTPKESLKQICASIRKDQRGEELYRIDLGQVSWEGCEKPRIFGISAGLGLDALVCKKALHSRLKQVLNRFHLGKLTYLALTVQSLFTMETANAKVITEYGGFILPKMIFAAAMNLPAEGGGVPMAPEASPEDGRLSLSSASGIAKWQTFFLLPFLVAAKQERINGFNIREENGFRVLLDKPMVLHADGEYCGDVTRVEFRCLEKKLWLLHEKEGD